MCLKINLVTNFKLAQTKTKTEHCQDLNRIKKFTHGQEIIQTFHAGR